jgi:hypothetical protein
MTDKMPKAMGLSFSLLPEHGHGAARLCHQSTPTCFRNSGTSASCASWIATCMAKWMPVTHSLAAQNLGPERPANPPQARELAGKFEEEVYSTCAANAKIMVCWGPQLGVYCCQRALMQFASFLLAMPDELDFFLFLK